MLRQRAIQELFSQSQTLMEKLTKSDHFNIKNKLAFNGSTTVGTCKRVSLKQAILYFSSKEQPKSVKWYSQSKRNERVKTLNRFRRETEIIDKIPQLSIQRQPIRCRTECQRSSPDKKSMEYSMVIIKKKLKSNLLLTPMSKSFALQNSAVEQPTQMMTQLVGEVVNLGVTRSKLHSRKQTKKKGIIQRREEMRKKNIKPTFTPKGTSRSESKINGWDVRNFQREEIIEFGTK